jgi:hypothetical protein
VDTKDILFAMGIVRDFHPKADLEEIKMRGLDLAEWAYFQSDDCPNDERAERANTAHHHKLPKP